MVSDVFAVLTILGIMADPTTEGMHDSDRAMTYTEPWGDADVESVPEPKTKGILKQK